MKQPIPPFLACLAFPLVLSLGACASTGSRSGSPDQVAAEILSAVDERRMADASDLFANVSDSEDDRQQLYPLLYEAAQERYVRGDAAGSTALLTFMSEEYPNAEAVQRALLYSLFLQRAQVSTASADLTDRMEASLGAVRSQAGVPAWVDLVETQLLIDQGRLSQALNTFERFTRSWTGQPAAIAIYVDDIERYLASH